MEPCHFKNELASAASGSALPYNHPWILRTNPSRHPLPPFFLSTSPREHPSRRFTDDAMAAIVPSWAREEEHHCRLLRLCGGNQEPKMWSLHALTTSVRRSMPRPPSYSSTPALRRRPQARPFRQPLSQWACAPPRHPCFVDCIPKWCIPNLNYEPTKYDCTKLLYLYIILWLTNICFLWLT